MSDLAMLNVLVLVGLCVSLGVIAYITRYHSLWPGDVISMGTAFRPGVAKRSLHTANITAYGGPVSVSITRLGKLVNPVRKMDEVAAHAAE